MKKPTRAFNFLIIFVFSIALWLLCTPFLAKRLVVERTLEKADVIIVLGGSSVFIERTQKAAQLFNQGVAPKIFLTNDGTKAGWSKKEQRNPPFVELAKQSLIEQDVPGEAIEILPEPVNGTFDEAELLQKKAGEKVWKSVLIVTSAYHTRRALRTFEKVFAENGTATEIGIESAPLGQQTPPPFFWWLTARGWQMVAGEYVKSLYYWAYY
ncbi:MAG: YdcF family protein [Acidobacteriota bacterium]|nr:YdcF family protein [Acidobacteriota bacterium]